MYVTTVGFRYNCTRKISRKRTYSTHVITYCTFTQGGVRYFLVKKSKNRRALIDRTENSGNIGVPLTSATRNSKHQTQHFREKRMEIGFDNEGQEMCGDGASAD